VANLESDIQAAKLTAENLRRQAGETQSKALASAYASGASGLELAAELVEAAQSGKLVMPRNL